MDTRADALGDDTLGLTIARLIGSAWPLGSRKVPTSLVKLDQLLAGGLHAGQTTIVASRSGDGASRFATGLARSAALHHGKQTVILAPDAPEIEVALRLIAAETRIPLRHLRSGDLSDRHRERLSECQQRLADAPLSIYADDPPAGTLPDSVGMVSHEDDVELVVADGIAMLGDTVRHDVTYMANWARREHFALVLVSSLHNRRSGEQRNTPQLSDLRDYDEVIDVVDNVLLIDRPELEFDPLDATVHVAKHRYGATGSVDVTFDESTAGFVNPPGVEEADPAWQMSSVWEMAG